MWRRASSSSSGSSYIFVPANPDLGTPGQTIDLWSRNDQTKHFIDYSFLGRWDYRLNRRWSLFVAAGYVRRWQHQHTVSVTHTTGGDLIGSTTSLYSDTTRSFWANGVAAGGGVSFNAGRFRIEPEYRYTGANNQEVSSGRWFNSFRRAWDHSHDFLLGIRF